MSDKVFQIHPVATYTLPTVSVAADDVETAIDKFWEGDPMMEASLCHHCSRTVTLDEVSSVIVYDEDGVPTEDGDMFSYTKHLQEIITKYKDKYGEL